MLEIPNQNAEVTTRDVDVPKDPNVQEHHELLAKEPEKDPKDEVALAEVEEELATNKDEDGELFEYLKKWRDKQEINLTDEQLKKIAKHPRWGKFVELEEKKKAGGLRFYDKSGKLISPKEALLQKKTNRVPDGSDIEYGGNKKDESSKKETAPSMQKQGKANERLTTISNEFVESQLMPKGKEQFMKVMETIAGKHAKEAYAQNMNLIKSEINAYVNGSISKDVFFRWCEDFNSRIREMGAESDVIDLNKIQKLKLKIINSRGADMDAW